MPWARCVSCCVEYCRGVFAAAALVFLAGSAGAWGVARCSSGRGLGLLCYGRIRRFCRVYDDGRHESSPIDQAERGSVGASGHEFVEELAFGLEPAEFGGRFEEQTMGLGAGAVDRVLDAFSVGVGDRFIRTFHGIGDVVLTIVETEDQAGFDFAAAAETPGGALDFVDEDVFEDADGGEIVEEGCVEGRIGALFAWADEVAGEEAESDGVFGGFGAARFGPGSGRGLCVRDVGCDLCW